MKLKKTKKKYIRLAFDGFSASGKSLAAKLISKKYKLHLLNSGLLYRYAALLILKNKPKNKISFLKIKFKNLNYKILTSMDLHNEEISNYVYGQLSEIYGFRYGCIIKQGYFCSSSTR